MTDGKSSFFDTLSRASSRQSELETSRSDMRSTSEHLMTHSRNLSQDSATTFRSMEQSQDSASLSMMFAHESLATPRQVVAFDSFDSNSQRAYESHSLPRRKCVHHSEEYQTHSLPRRDLAQHYRDYYQQSESFESSSRDDRLDTLDMLSREPSLDSNVVFHDPMKRRYSCGVAECQRMMSSNVIHEVGHLVRRNSTNNFYQQPQNGEETPSDEMCSTCESETESEEEDDKQEKEIFIDFKPRISPVPSPRSRKKKLQKTLSEGEILLEKRREGITDDVTQLSAASEEDITLTDRHLKPPYMYSNVPIKDEGICDKNNLLKLPEGGIRNRREAFRKRSISLEEQTGDEDASESSKPAKSGPPSPCLDEKCNKNMSAFPSSDSLVNDSAREHSDGNWNESQATVLLAEPIVIDSGPSLLTPTTKRKNLLLQHQQRSSMDTEALEMEDHFNEQVSPPSLRHLPFLHAHYK